MFSGDIRVNPPTEEDISWTLKDDVAWAQISIEVVNRGLWSINDLLVELQMMDERGKLIAARQSKAAHIGAGSTHDVNIEIPLDLASMVEEGDSGLFLETTTLILNANATAKFTLGLIGTKIVATQPIYWDPILERMEFPSANVVGSIQDGRITFKIPYHFQTATWYDRDLFLNYSIENDTTSLYQGSRTIQGGGTSQGEIVAILSEDDSKEYLTQSESFDLEWTLGLDESRPITAESRDMEWGAPFHKLNITRITNTTFGLELKYVIFNRYSSDVNGTIEIEVYDGADTFLGSRTGFFNLSSGSGIEHTIPVSFNWDLVTSDPLRLDLTWREDSLGIEFSRSMSYVT